MNIFADHKAAVKKLAEWKIKEMKLRLDIVEALASDEISGTYNYFGDETNGYQVKIVKSLNFSIDAEILESIYDDLPPNQREAIVFKPSLVKSIYNELEFTDEIDEALMVKEATPTVKIL